MKKKILATLLAGALVATSAAGLAACGGVSMPKGDEVTAEEWVEAFANTGKITNYTLEGSADVDVTVKGTVKKNDGSYIDPITGEYKTKTKDANIDVSTDTSVSVTILYDEEGNKAYSESSSTSKMSGEVDGEEGKSSSKYVSKEYYELSKNDDGDKTYWRARYSLKEESSSDSEEKSEGYEENYWKASETTSFASNSITYYLLSETTFYETNEEGATPKSVTELYEKFEYSGGKYTATLYQRERLYSSVYEFIECTVSLSFNKAESCVIGLSIKCNGKGTASKDGEYNLEYSYKGESVYSLSNVKSTDVSKKASKDITKAIDKAKADLEDND